jgi:outer membrane immunogenic protein
MRRLNFVCVATAALLAGLAQTASAADLPFKAAPAVAPAGYDWSGLYVGGHVGGGWSSNDFSDPALGIIGTLLGVPAVQTTNSSGFLGGIQGGWNYQIGRLVVGTEVDLSWADINGTSSTSFAPLIAPGTSFNRSLTANTDWTGSATVRLGYARDHWMFYSKGGAAFAHTAYTDNWTATAGAVTVPFFAGTGAQTRVGWTLGTGVEWAFLNNWSAKLEYDYMDFGSKTVPINGSVGPIPLSFSVVNSQAISEVKLGLNYRFTTLP